MSSTTPLSGLVVIEIGHSIAAPYAGMILGELGAEVIKVENPRTGDAARGWGPPFAQGAATCFHAVNRAKCGITIDLADPADAEKLKKLILDPRRRVGPQSQIRRARPLRFVVGRTARRKAKPYLLQSRCVWRGRANARASGLRPTDAGPWRADEPDGRGWAAAGAGRRVDRRSRHWDVGRHRHPRSIGRAAPERPRRGYRHVAL